jgi:hypothetical protein
MSPKSSSASRRDPDLANAEIALKRAVRRLRDQARREGIPLVYLDGGAIRVQTPLDDGADEGRTAGA